MTNLKSPKGYVWVKRNVSAYVKIVCKTMIYSQPRTPELAEAFGERTEKMKWRTQYADLHIG